MLTLYSSPVQICRFLGANRQSALMALIPGNNAYPRQDANGAKTTPLQGPHPYASTFPAVANCPRALAFNRAKRAVISMPCSRHRGSYVPIRQGATFSLA